MQLYRQFVLHRTKPPEKGTLSKRVPPGGFVASWRWRKVSITRAAPLIQYGRHGSHIGIRFRQLSGDKILGQRSV
jgi:hypothetical protein